MYKALILMTIVLAAVVGCSDTSKDTATPTHTDTSSEAATAAVCPVSGEKLGSMGDPVVVEVKGQKVKLCCEGCKDALLENPNKYLAKTNTGSSGHEGHSH